jgi:predicted alpha/beta superfamily hydrolase
MGDHAASGSASRRHLRVTVHYPPAKARLTLRTELDWQRDVEPVTVDHSTGRHEFELATDRPFLYFKPVWTERTETRWAVGPDYLVLASADGPTEVFPHFDPNEPCTVCELKKLADPEGDRFHAYRVFCPPGYHENTLRRYPVLYMQDGQNLFFSDEAFQGTHWRVSETLDLLQSMSLIHEVIVVGVHPQNRMEDYTLPGYEAYGRFLVQRLKPAVDGHYRTLSERQHTGVMGSSLGGVVSFFLTWQYPEIFGMAACMSSTFGYRDDLLERVATEPMRPIRLYIDSGWPRDNFEVTRDMRELLLQRGFTEGTDLFYLAFPEALHDEQHWATRAHIPFQFLFGRPGGRPPTPAKPTRRSRG